MKNLVQIDASPHLPEKWDYDSSVRKVKTAIYKWKNLTVEVAEDLWVAREKLAVKPEDRERDTTGTFVPVDATWKSYCRDIGSEKRTVNRWLARIYNQPIATENIEPQSLPEGKFHCIYADPPWKYSNQATRASTDKHYRTMTPEDIAALPVETLAADDCHLHLWTTNAFLFEAKSIIEAWGFEYKSVFLWVKSQMGIGNYWRVSHEFLLFGIRGRLPFQRKDVMSWIEEPRGHHSAKPERIREIVEGVSPGPYLELFARKTHPGWTVWGNEIEHDLFSRKNGDDELRGM